MTKPLQPRAARTRQLIIGSAATAVDLYGPEASLGQMCEAAGISRGALNHHFALRQDVLASIRSAAETELALLGRQLLRHPGPLAEAVDELATALRGKLRSDTAIRAGTQLLLSDRTTARALIRRTQRILRRRAVVESRRGRLRRRTPPRATAALFTCVLVGLEAVDRLDTEWWDDGCAEGMWQLLMAVTVADLDNDLTQGP
ncbi:TetR/AcrR family transcriptional regulator [Streptomyces sp. NPDC050636]|uniref:TetR/AcrR family transcriptional regulator n=1 Tax=Streptomyces sp. NPDC050636 TaxID=3154510 RepID=UPI003418ECAB